MTDKIKCPLCDTEFEAHLLNCTGCQTETSILTKKVALPLPRGIINDYASVMTSQQQSELAGILDDFFKRTDVPIIVSVVQETGPLTPSEYAFLMYNMWGIGAAGTNRGLLLLLAMKDKHLESEIGLGLERFLPEVEGDEIVQSEFLPHFTEGGFYEGLKAGAEAIMKVLEERLPSLD